MSILGTWGPLGRVEGESRGREESRKNKIAQEVKPSEKLVVGCPFPQQPQGSSQNWFVIEFVVKISTRYLQRS